MAGGYHVISIGIMARSQLITLLVFGLVIFGLIMIGSASVVDASRDFGNKWYYLRLQSTWAVLGLVGFAVASRFPHRHLEKYASPMLVAILVLLLAVLIPGIGMKLLGARRWINLGFFAFQPAELTKLVLCIYLGKLLQYKVSFVSFISVIGLICGLIMLEPDLGTAIVVSGMSLLTYITYTGQYKQLVFFAPLALLAVAALIMFSPYRRARLQTYLDHAQDPQGASYHIHQALLGFGSGGIFGLGLGQSRQKYEFLPEATTDSIFSIIGEELGFVGAAAVIAVFAYLIHNCFQVAMHASHPFSSVLALAISSWIGIQTFLNISAIIALVPLTGIPLTFISYGGSSLFLVMVAMGILVNVARSQNYAK